MTKSGCGWASCQVYRFLFFYFFLRSFYLYLFCTKPLTQLGLTEGLEILYTLMPLYYSFNKFYD